MLRSALKSWGNEHKFRIKIGGITAASVMHVRLPRGGYIEVECF